MHMTLPTPKSILQWDTLSWSAALGYWEENAQDLSNRLGLELGGREGGLSLWLAGKGMFVTCSDLSGVRESARPLHEKFGVASQINYEDIDATNIPYKDKFDVIVFKSIIGGIGRGDNIEIQKKVFREIHKALKPGGKLFFAENLTASPLHRFFRKRFTNWGDSWRYVTHEEMEMFLQPFSRYELKSTGVTAAFGRTEFQRNILARADRIFFNHLCPDSWKYIGYGMAVK